MIDPGPSAPQRRATGRPRRLVFRLAMTVVLLLLCTAGAVTLAQASDSAGDRREHGETQMEEASLRAEQEAERDRTRRQKPEERAKRLRSKADFQDDDGARALGLAKEKFESVLTGPVWHGPKDRLQPGERVSRYLSDFSALVDDGSGHTGLVESSVPLRSDEATGSPRAIDLRLEHGVRGFSPANSADVRIPDRLAGGVQFARTGVSLRVPGSSGSDSAREADDKVFYADVAQDTDLLVAPTPVGIRTFHQLRSVASPEDQPLSFDVPPGARLRETDNRDGADVIGRDGKVLLHITPPQAVDADGQPVPASYRVDGTTLTLHIDHRSGDWLYPILVDPDVYEQYGDTFGGYGDWDPNPDNSNGRISWSKTYKLYLRGTENVQHYANESRFWTLPARADAPRNSDGSYNTDAFIYRTEWDIDFASGGTTELGMGIRRPDGVYEGGVNQTPLTTQTSQNYMNPLICARSGCSPTVNGGGAAGNAMKFYLKYTRNFRDQTTVPRTGLFWGAAYRYDESAPRFTPVLGDSRGANDSLASTYAWQREGTNGTVYLPGKDAGLGVATFRFTRGATTEEHPVRVTPVNHPGELWDCDGSRFARCPLEARTNFTYSTDQLAEGRPGLHAEVKDIIGRMTPLDWNVRVDKTAPTVAAGNAGAVKPNAKLDAGNQSLIVEANDIGASNAENSGVKRVEYQIDGGAWTGEDTTCSSGGCSKTYSIDTRPGSGLVEGRHTVSLRVRDGVGHWSAPSNFAFIVDRSDPSAPELSGALYEKTFLGGARYGLHVVAHDGATSPDSAVRSGVSSVVLKVDGVERDRKNQDQNCDQGSCDLPADLYFDASKAEVREGRQNVELIVNDYTGHSRSVTTRPLAGASGAPQGPWEVVVDRGAPNPVTVGGSLKTVEGTTLQTGAYTLNVDSRDGAATPREAERSGVTETRIFVDSNPADADPGAEQKPDQATQPCPTGSCPQQRAYAFIADDWGPGDYVVRVRVRDQAANAAPEQTVKVKVGSLVSEVSDKSGLEDFFHYESTKTGDGTQAHVNLATGNLVWHSTPIVNPGRGLSTVVNLTYNSQLREAIDKWPFAYRQVGRGFSLGISGLTRLNEPLIDLGGSVLMTDPDGTQHTFTLGSDGLTYKEPSGVNLRLRRYSPAPPDPSQEPSTPGLIEEFQKHWAITQPNGVTHFFDLRGYPTSIEDRNGNTIQFKYRSADPLNTDGVCKLVKDAVCKVEKVVDPAGRELEITYGSLTGAPAAPPKPTTGDTVAQGQEKLRQLRAWAANVGRIVEIKDHAGRITRFVYDESDQLNLKGVVQAAGRPDERTWQFDYRTGVDPDLTGVTDPNGHKTEITYGIFPTAPPPNSTTPALDRVKEVKNRRGKTTKFNYDSPLLDAETDLRTRTTVTDARDKQTEYRLDGRARLSQMRDPLGTLTQLGWDADNNVATLTEAAGSSDEAITRMAYNPNGMLVSKQDPENHTTRLVYRDGAGQHLSKLYSPTESAVDPAKPSVDKDGTFVSDLTKQEMPRGTATAIAGDFTWQFSPDARGNVTSRTDPENNVGKTTFDSNGRILTEEDEVGKVTKYRDFDLGGQPQTKEDPKAGLWKYTYDPVGNVLSMTDPRGGKAGQPARAFKTTLTYDAFDRMLTQEVPKRSEQSEFVTRKREYDNNGNLRFYEDGNGKRWERTYTFTDEVESSTTPAAAHFEQSAPASEVTHLSYDDEDNLTEMTRPLGSATSTTGDWATEYSYDDLGRKLTAVRKASDGNTSSLALSYAYDRRGNQIGLVDPRHNAACGGTPAENAANADCRRFTYEYDRSDNRTAQIEDPAGENLRTAFGYDENDNQISKIDPRGFKAAKSGETPSPARYTSQKEYYADDQLKAEIDPLGRKKLIERRADNTVSAEISPKGTATAVAGDYTTKYAHNDNGELLSRSLPYDTDQYGSKSLEVSYTRDAVGNPEKIKDARGNEFTNEFLDTGELASTERPSWFTVDQGESADGRQLAVREKNAKELLKQPAQEALPSAQGKGDLGEVKPQDLPELLPKAGKTTFGYDNELRLASVTDVADHATSITRDEVGRITEIKRPYDLAADPQRFIITRSAFDANGNVRQTLDGEGHETVKSYDQFDRLVKIKRPGSNAGDETTNLTYDQNGNQTAEETPRGTATGTDGDFTSHSEFDGLDRQISETNPAAEKTTSTYDPAGNRVWERSPRGNVTGLTEPERQKFDTRSEFDQAGQKTKTTDGNNEETLFEYDLNGNKIKEDAPGARRASTEPLERRITARRYEGRDLLWAETTGTKTTAESDTHKRTTVTEHDPNGNLRRTVNPAGVNEDTGQPTFTYTADSQLSDANASKQANVRDYSTDNLLTAVHQPWGTRDSEDEKRYVQRFKHNSRGWICAIIAPDDGAEPSGDPCESGKGKTTYKHFDTGWISESKDPTYTNAQAKSQTVTYNYDLRGNQTLWKTATGREVRREYFDSGELEKRTAEGPGGSPGQRSYTYEYNHNRSLTKTVDEQKSRTTKIDYDPAERDTVTNEDWTGGKDTNQHYDAEGHVINRQTDGKVNGTSYDGGKTATYDFDRLGREFKATVDPSATNEKTRTTQTTYYPSGEKEQVKKDQQGDTQPVVTESWFYFNDGRPARAQRQKSGASGFEKNQGYSYDRNGNRTADERGTHEFDSRDEHVKWTRRTDSSLGTKSGQAASYKFNGSGGMSEKKDGSETSTNQYDGDRLTSSATSGGSSGGTSSNYSYDDFGAVTSIGDGGGSGAGTTYGYDDFGRVTKGTGPDGKAQDFTYDGLDRRDSKSQDGKTSDMSYVGITESLSQEQGPGTDATKTKTRSYDYDSSGERLGQSSGDGSTATYRSYAKDANGSVEGVQESDGQVKPENKYEYDPYGELDKKPGETQPGDSLGTEAKDNPFRFEGFYQDDGIKTYDMQARPYRPDVGRFLTQDRYEDSKADLNLQTDPLTQNRYAFAGGNPINRVEWDGHWFGEDVANDLADTADESWNDLKKPAVDAYNASKGVIHATLDVAGFFPGLGALPDLANAGLYGLEGNGKKAAESGVAAVPFAGDGFKAAKVGAKGLKAAKGADKGAEVGKGIKTGGGGGTRANKGCNSFTGRTPVLLANGKRKPIAEVRVGDLITTTDTKTGKTLKRRVTRLIIGHGKKTLVRIRLRGHVLTATAGHPIWVTSKHRWTRARNLRGGDRLRDPNGRLATVQGTRTVVAANRTVYNFTVEDTHTYYVAAGKSWALVHNDSCESPSRRAAYRRAKRDQGIPMGRQPDERSLVNDRTNPGKKVTEHRFSRNGNREDDQVIRHDRHGHPEGRGPSRPHFNASESKTHYFYDLVRSIAKLLD